MFMLQKNKNLFLLIAFTFTMSLVMLLLIKHGILPVLFVLSRFVCKRVFLVLKLVYTMFYFK